MVNIMSSGIVVRAAFPQGWRSNKYDQDEIMPATEEQARRLTQAGVAYYDFVEDEKPTMNNTKKEIEQYLDGHDIEYDEYATKAELLELIDGE